MKPVTQFKINILTNHAKPLLYFLAQLGLTANKKNITKEKLEELHSLLIQEINLFNKRITPTKINRTSKIAASYCLVTAIDEAIMNSIMNFGLDWSQRSLLSIFHNETWGGERFYLILTYALKHHEEQHELIELIHLLLCLGFKGKFYHVNSSFLKSIKNVILKNIQNIHASTRDTTHEIHINTKDGFDFKILSSMLKKSLVIIMPLTLIMLITFNIMLSSSLDIEPIKTAIT